MTTTILTLDGANGTLLTAFTPSAGGGFAALSTNTTSAFNASNRLLWNGPVSYTVSQYAYTVGVSSADYTVSSTFRWTNSAGPAIADTMCIRARSSNANRQGYLMTFDGTQGQLYRVDSAGTATAIGAAVTYASVGLGASALDTDYVGSLTVNGTTLTAKFRGVTLFSYTDSTLTAADYAGIGGNSGSSFGSAIQVTDMTIETLAGPAINRIIPSIDVNKSQVQLHDPFSIIARPVFKPVVVHP